jgi:hypothetical protein
MKKLCYFQTLCSSENKTIFSTKVSKLIYFPSLIISNCLITFIKIHNWLLSELNQYTCHGTCFLCVYFVTWSYHLHVFPSVPFIDRFDCTNHMSIIDRWHKVNIHIFWILKHGFSFQVPSFRPVIDNVPGGITSLDL